MPVQIDPNIVKIAVELENHQAQLIEFDQKISLTSKSRALCTHTTCGHIWISSIADVALVTIQYSLKC